MKTKFRISPSFSLITFWVLFTGLVILRILFPRFETHDVTAFLSWDVISHYIWLPAFFIHDDLGIHDFGWVDHMLRQYQPLIGYGQAILQTGTPNQVFSSTMGMALMYAPFFMTGHLVAIMSGFLADGFSVPYQAAIAIGGLFYSALGIWLMRKVLLDFFNEKITAFTMVVIVLMSGYVNLGAFNGASPENLLFTLYLLLIYLTTRLHVKPTYVIAASFGLVAGLIFLIRPFDGILMIAWQFYVAQRLAGKHLHLTAFIVFCFLFTGSFQVIYWKIFSGHFYFEAGNFMPATLQAYFPYIALETIPAGYFLRYLTGKKVSLQYVFLVVFCCVAAWNIYHSVRFQIILNHYDKTPAKFFYRYDHKEAIPVSQHYAAKTFLTEESEVLDHPRWFKTRRIFSLKPGLIRMDNRCRFSPGIYAPLSDFSNKPWIGLQARIKIYCNGPSPENSGNLVITLLRDHQAVNWKGLPFDDKNLKAHQWNELKINYIIHNPQKNDMLQAYVWYTGNRQVMIGSLTVTLFEMNNDE